YASVSPSPCDLQVNCGRAGLVGIAQNIRTTVWERIMPSEYVHGTQPKEQQRLGQLNHWINKRCLSALRLAVGQRVIDFGTGLGQLTSAMARAVGTTGYVLGIERSPQQLDAACRTIAGASDLLPEFRLGTVEDPPLADSEWGSFDVA